MNCTYDIKNNGTGYPELSWHGEKPWSFNVSNDNLSLALMYVEDKHKYNLEEDTFRYMAINMHWEMHIYELPIEDQSKIVVNPRSIIILLGK